MIFSPVMTHLHPLPLQAQQPNCSIEARDGDLLIIEVKADIGKRERF
ncbi:MAG: hypothetical protein V7K47_25585 [Nostoc sp.]